MPSSAPPPLAKVFGPSECQWCGASITQGKRGPFRVFCSAACQSASWVAEHPVEVAEKRQVAYMVQSAQVRDATRARARARQRALSRLAERYPDDYRWLYEAALAEGRPTTDDEGSE